MGSTLLILAIALAPLGVEASTPDGEAGQDPIARDSVSQDSVSEAGPQAQGEIPSEVFEALWISEQLVVLRDSIETGITGQDTLAGPQRQVVRSRVRGWIEEAAELQRDLVDPVSYTHLTLPTITE